MLGFSKKTATKRRKKLKGLFGTFKLPSFPTLVLQTLEKIRDPKATPAAVSESLAMNPGASVFVLSTVNSAAFGMRKKVDNLQQAVALLGMSSVESLLLSLAVRNAVPDGAAQGFDPRRFWAAAARRAVTARALARLLHPATTSESFLAALLQDMALPLLAHGQKKKYGPLLEHWHNSDENLFELERKEFGWDHAEVASWICEEWDLPESLSSNIRGHHEPPSKETPGCLAAVALVSCLRETEDRPGLEPLIETARTQYGISPDVLDDLISTSFEQAGGLAASFV